MIIIIIIIITIISLRWAPLSSTSRRRHRPPGEAPGAGPPHRKARLIWRNRPRIKSPSKIITIIIITIIILARAS
jgi:hypothetical protein